MTLEINTKPDTGKIADFLKQYLDSGVSSEVVDRERKDTTFLTLENPQGKIAAALSYTLVHPSILFMDPQAPGCLENDRCFVISEAVVLPEHRGTPYVILLLESLLESAHNQGFNGVYFGGSATAPSAFKAYNYFMNKGLIERTLWCSKKDDRSESALFYVPIKNALRLARGAFQLSLGRITPSPA